MAMATGWEFSDEVLRKGHRYYRLGRVHRTGALTYEVQGGRVGRPYVVSTDASEETGRVSWASCSCAHGRHVGAHLPICSHIAAVLLLVKDGRDKGQAR